MLFRFVWRTQPYFALLQRDIASFIHTAGSEETIGYKVGSVTEKMDTSNARHSTSSLSFVQDLTNLFTDSKGSNRNASTASIYSLEKNEKGRTRQQQQQQQHQGEQKQGESVEKTQKVDQPQQPSSSSSQLTDILVEKLLSMAIPPATEVGAETLQGRIQAGKSRPALSVQTMSKNFIQMNSRLSAPFEFIDNVIRFFSWDQPSLTLTVLMLYTHVVLNPLILLGVPFFFMLIYVMAPAYALAHKPGFNPNLGKNNPIVASGPPLMAVEPPQPASEFSKEFILNLTDLQNHMVLYTIAWDFCVKWMSKFAFFKHETVSAAFFLGLLTMGVSALAFGDVIVHYIPFKLILLLCGWGFTIIFHPYFYDTVFNWVYSEDTRYYFLGKTNRIEDAIDRNLNYQEPQEQREVEIFEVHEFNKELKEWQLVCYLDTDFTAMTPERLNLHETGTSSFGAMSKNEIRPPKDWGFVTSDDWRIDLSPEQWVKMHCVSYFVRIDNETKWVYDIADETNQFQPKFRRRRWTRIVTRCSTLSQHNESNNSTNNNEEVLTTNEFIL